MSSKPSDHVAKSTPSHATPTVGATKKAKIYIPDHLPNSPDVIRHVAFELCKLYGGATEIPGLTGRWVDDSGELIEESVTVLESIAETVSETDLKPLAEYIRTELKQDVVLFEIDETAATFV